MNRFVRLMTAAALLLAVGGVHAHAQPRKRGAEPPPAPAPAPPPDIRVHSRLTQTAAWVGDPLAFVVEIEMVVQVAAAGP